MNHIRTRPGVLLLDILVGTAVFAILVGMVVFSMLFAQRGILSSGDRIRAVHLSQQALEAARSIRDGDFDNLTAGTYGASLSGGTWVLSGTGVTTSDSFTTTVTVASIDADSFRISAKTRWNFGQNRSGSAVLVTELTDWRKAKPLGNWSTVSLDGSYIDSDNPPLFNDAIVKDQYAFVSSEDSSSPGLYVFDISNTASPTRVASSFSLGGDGGYDLFLDGNNLYVVTDSSNSEIQIYDVSSPATFSDSDLLATINISGSGQADSVVISGDFLFVAAKGSKELYSFNISNLSSIDSLDSLDDSDKFNDIGISQNYVYAATTVDTFELRVVDILNPSDLKFTAGGGYNLTDTPDGLAIKTFDNYLLLGRSAGDVTNEIVLFDITGGGDPSPPPGPWYQEAGATVNAIDIEPSGTYAFVATENDGKELQIEDITLFVQSLPPEISYYDTTTGVGRGVYYTIEYDRVFLMTNTAFLILKPGS